MRNTRQYTVTYLEALTFTMTLWRLLNGNKKNLCKAIRRIISVRELKADASRFKKKNSPMLRIAKVSA